MNVMFVVRRLVTQSIFSKNRFCVKFSKIQKNSRNIQGKSSSHNHFLCAYDKFLDDLRMMHFQKECCIFT